MSDKIRPQHLSRKAILYVRQSSAYQLGWREIEVVDEDLGRSAAGTVPRVSFRTFCLNSSNLNGF